jgi:AcrR family transcriptional regulator
MPRVALNEKQIGAFRKHVVQAATRLFATEGYEAVTMRRLAARLRVSPMTPYRYFEDKEDLFAAVKTAAFHRFADRQAAAFAKDGPPGGALLRLGRAYIRFALDEPDAYRIMFELRPKTTRPYPELEREQKRSFSYLQQAVEAAAGQSGTEDSDPLTAAHLAWAQVHGIVSLHLAGKLIMGRSLEEIVEAALPMPESET